MVKALFKREAEDGTDESTVPPNPTPVWRTGLQVLVSTAVSVALTQLTRLAGHLTPIELAGIYIPLTGVYYAGVAKLENTYPTWGWLFFLLPTQLPS